jgi:tubulin-specific chaperone A
MSETNTEASRFAAKVKQAEDPNEKALRIKVNALKRTIKDLVYAKNEVERETERLEQIRKSDPDRVPQQEKVIDEARMMVPHSENRIMSSVKELSDFLAKEGDSISNKELVEQARATILDGQSAVS